MARLLRLHFSLPGAPGLDSATQPDLGLEPVLATAGRGVLDGAFAVLDALAHADDGRSIGYGCQRCPIHNIRGPTSRPLRVGFSSVLRLAFCYCGGGGGGTGFELGVVVVGPKHEGGGGLT